MRSTRIVWAGLLVLVCTASCQALVGYEEREQRPEADAGDSGTGGTSGSYAGGSGSGGTAGAAGSSATGGAPGVDAGPDADTDASLDGDVEVGPDATTDSGIIYGPTGRSCEGMDGGECRGKSCCSTILVEGGETLPMGSDVEDDERPEHDATVSDFYLDEFEVTVGRFREFVRNFDYTPPSQGDGRHPLIPGSGWVSEWNGKLASSEAELTENLNCDATYQTWLDAPEGTEDLPINCVNWYEAFAFCWWDGGRLPTEAEWEYAAAGGSENQLYPWGDNPPNKTLAVFGCLHAGTSSCAFEDIAAVGSVPAGAGLWGHEDLAGNMWEWALDWYADDWYSTPEGHSCNNCANLNTVGDRVLRGGSFKQTAAALRGSNRNQGAPLNHNYYVGFRCARNP